jgi:hypothetical protein
VPLFAGKVAREGKEAAQRFAEDALAVLLTVLLIFLLLGEMLLPLRERRSHLGLLRTLCAHLLVQLHVAVDDDAEQVRASDEVPKVGRSEEQVQVAQGAALVKRTKACAHERLVGRKPFGHRGERVRRLGDRLLGPVERGGNLLEPNLRAFESLLGPGQLRQCSLLLQPRLCERAAPLRELLLNAGECGLGGCHDGCIRPRPRGHRSGGRPGSERENRDNRPQE